jgi:hypothetical protein
MTDLAPTCVVSTVNTVLPDILGCCFLNERIDFEIPTLALAVCTTLVSLCRADWSDATSLDWIVVVCVWVAGVGEPGACPCEFVDTTWVFDTAWLVDAMSEVGGSFWGRLRCSRTSLDVNGQNCWKHGTYLQCSQLLHHRCHLALIVHLFQC